MALPDDCFVAKGVVCSVGAGDDRSAPEADVWGGLSFCFAPPPASIL